MILSRKKQLLAFTFVLAIAALPAISFAQSQTTGLPSSQTTGLPPSQTTGGSFQLHNPLAGGGINSFCGMVKTLLNAMLTLGIPVAVLFLVWAGFLFIWARGNAEGLAMARRNLFYVVIGIGLFLGAWSLGQVIAATLTNVQGSGNSVAGSCA